MPDDPETEKPALKPAATNPWYVLMTVAGEQTGDWFDQRLHIRNRRYWNGWVAQALPEDEKARLIAGDRATEHDLTPLTEAELAEIKAALRNRCRDAGMPDPRRPADLRWTTLEALFSATDFLFPQGADFERATFSRDVAFEGATFSGSILFGRTTFFGDARFAGAIFSLPVSFEDATFSLHASFEEATFAFARFENTIFSGDAIFRGAVFLGHVVMANAAFSCGAMFADATFSLNAIFRSAIFSNEAEFENATFTGYAAFESTTFCGTATFRDTTFSAVTSFNRWKDQDDPPQTRFLSHPPEFFGAKMHEDTDFTDVDWPPVPDDADPERRRSRAIRHRRAYERLKLLMDSQKKVADELMFQRLELRCREAEAIGDWRTREWWVARVSRLYGVLSDYGWDPVRPALWLIYLWLAGWALIARADTLGHILEQWPDVTPPPNVGFWQSAALSASNLFGFLGFNRTLLAEEVRMLTTVSEVVSGAQTVFGLVLFFLMGLALRNRFRIK